MTGPIELLAWVQSGTTLPKRYLDHASHRSMTAYLEDWERAYARLGGQIRALREARDERLAATEAGTWPAA